MFLFVYVFAYNCAVLCATRVYKIKIQSINETFLQEEVFGGFQFILKLCSMLK